MACGSALRRKQLRSTPGQRDHTDFCVYVIVNMGMVAGILPVVGVPLPFVSFGGTSIVTLLLGFGILSAISTEKRIISQ